MPLRMVEMKSPADQLVQIVKETILDGYDLIRLSCSVKTKYEEMDLQYIERRTASEGLEFLTTTLPVLGEWFDEVFLKDKDSSVPVGFKPCGRLSPTALLRVEEVPLFLFPFWRYLSDIRTRDTDDYFKLIRIARTIFYGLKKLEVEPSPDQVAEKLETFRSIEEELKTFIVDWTDPVLQEAQRLCETVFSNWDPKIRPKHGPGAVAGREKGTRKWEFSRYWRSVHNVFPAYDYFWPLRSNFVMEGRRVSHRLQLASYVNAYKAITWDDYPIARLLFVPKDSRGPRIISCEPKELMYLQQGVSRAMMTRLEHHPLTKGHVNFVDQSVNGKLALEASASREYATLDLSDASDRVSKQLVEYLFPRGISRQLLALRSAATEYEGEIIPLQKYAPMGSALCFPVESSVFWALCVAAIVNNGRSLTEAKDLVYVYGDDIVVATEYAEICINALTSCCLKVNEKKSLTGSHGFRESCGIDAFKGHNVTPSRIRKLPPRGPRDGTSLVAYAKYAENSLYSVRRSRRLAESAERIVGPIPRTPIPQQFLHIVDPQASWNLDKFPDAKWSESRQYYRAKLLRMRVKSSIDPLDPWYALTRSLIELGTRDAARVVTDPVTLIKRGMCDISYISPFMGG